MNSLKFLFKHKLFCLGFIVLYVFSLSLIFYWTQVFQQFDHRVFDIYTRHFRLHAQLDPKVKVILIDDDTLVKLAPALGRWPWKRSIYRDIIEFINMGSPKAIYMDIFFVEQELGTESDRVFAQAITGAGNVHLGMNFTRESEQSFIKPALPPEIIAKYALSVNNHSHVDFAKYQTYMLPIPELLKGSRSLPVYTIDSDQDGIFRRVPLVFKYGNNYFPSLALSALSVLAGTNHVDIYDGSLQIGRYNIPIDQQGKSLINWYPASHESLSMLSILSSRQQLLTGDVAHLSIDPSVFKDAIVIVGAGATGTYDLKSTPINLAIAGSELHSTLISNVLKNEVVKPFSSAMILFVLSVFLALMTAWSLLYVNQIIVKYILPVALFLFLLGVSIFLFIHNNIYFMLSNPSFSLALTYLLSLAYISVTETREKLRIRKTFSKYLAPAIMHEVLLRWDEVEPEVGKKIEATILFSDIRSFTTISENYPVELVVKLLNEYFEVMISEIHLQKGTLDKMIGDAIMAFWNSPIPVEDHALRALTAAFKMQEAMTVLNEGWLKLGYPKLKIGIGINTGEAIIGNIGSKSRVDFTAIGDNVNLASRLEGLCKLYYASIVISEYTQRIVGAFYPCRVLDKVRVKGKIQPISIFEPCPLTSKPMVDHWNGIFELYLSQQWDAMLNALDVFMLENPNDQLAKFYYKRVQSHKSQHLPEDWDGVFTLETK